MTNELGDLKDKYREVVELLRDTQEQLRNTRSDIQTEHQPREPTVRMDSIRIVSIREVRDGICKLRKTYDKRK